MLMSDANIIEIITVAGGLIAIIKPMLKLNTSIVKLTDAIKVINERMTNNDKRTDAHEHKLQDHEIRIDRLEHHNK